MTDNASISDDDISREGTTEGDENRDTGAQHGKDSGDVSDDDEPTEAVENFDVGGEGERDSGDD
jgi:hypothetical protein